MRRYFRENLMVVGKGKREKERERQGGRNKLPKQSNWVNLSIRIKE